MRRPIRLPKSWLALLVALCALVGAPTLALAQGEVRTSANPRTVEVGQHLSFTVTAHVEGNQPIRILGAPDFKGAFQSYGSSSSERSLVRNGQVVQILSYSYRLRALKEGRHTIEPPVIQAGNERLSPSPVTVTVTEPGKGPSRRNSKRRRDRDERVFVDHSLEPTTRPYVGEQVTLAYFLYADAFRLKVEPAPPDEPSLDDFWIEDLSQNFSGHKQTMRIDGKVMERANLRAYALFPLRAGSTKIEPLEVDIHMGGFLRQPQQRRLKSDAIELDVQPLPPDAPASFYEGNVGQWEFRVTTDRIKAKMGRSITIRLTATGQGQLGRIALPKLPEVEGARVAGSDEVVEREIERGVVGGKKTMEYTLVPEREGTLTIPSVEFSYFDPKQEKYQTIRTQPIEIDVKGGELTLDHQAAPELEPDDSREEADVLDTLVDKLGAPADDVALGDTKEPFSKSPFFWLLVAVPGLGIVLLYLKEPLAKFWSRERPRRRRGKPYKEALSKLAAAEDLPPSETLDEIRAAVALYVTRKAGVAAGAVSESALPGQLERLGVSSELAERLGTLLRQLDEARYSPDKSAKATRASELRDEARDCLEALEKSRRAKSWSANAAAILLAAAIAATGALAPTYAHANDDRTQTLDEAVAAQKDGRWEEAAALWQQIADEHPHTPKVLYNLGAALAHTGNYGRARLALEQAALHAPGDDAIEKNRDLVHQIVRLRQIEQARGTVRENTTSEGLFWWRFATGVSADFFPWTIVVLIWFLFGASLARRLSKNAAVRDGGLTIAAICALGIAVAVGGWLARRQILSTIHPAVVLAQDSPLREGPSEHAGLADIDTVIVPGVLLPVEERRDGWVKLGFADGSSAWTPRANVEMVE